MKEEKKKSFNVVVFLMTIFYFLLLLPYIVHSNLENVGVVKDFEVIQFNSFPDDIREFLVTQKDSYTVLMVENVLPKRKMIIISDESNFVRGTIVEATDSVVDRSVDWHGYAFTDYHFDKIIIGEIKSVGRIESFFELLFINLPSDVSGLILTLSKLNFLIGPIVLVLCLSFLLRGNLGLWNIFAIPAFYSFEFFCSNMLKVSHEISISSFKMGIGYIFVILLPIAIWVGRFEVSPKGKDLIQRTKRFISSSFIIR